MTGMKALKDRIESLSTQTEQNEADIQEQLRLIGDSLFRMRHPVLDREGFSELRTESDEYEDKIQSNRERIHRIKQIMDRRQEIKDETGTTTKEIKDIESRLAPVYEKIGETGFSLYRDNAYLEKEYQDLFSELQAHQDELDQIEKEMNDIQEQLENKNFLEKMMLRGRVVLLKNRKSSKMEGFIRLFRTAGEEICTGTFGTELNDPSLAAAMEPYNAAKNRIAELRSHLETLEQEKETLDAELAQHGADKKPQKTIGDLERSTEVLGIEQQICFEKIADLFRETSGEFPDLPEDVTSAYTYIEKLEQENQEHQEHIKRLEAAISILRLETESGKMRDTIHVFEREINERREKIDELEHKIQDNEKEKERLITIRGPEDTL
jgi:chromosome segregation ATPase